MECPILPAEVCLPITEELVRECAVTAIHELLQGRSPQALDSELNLSLGVWARYISVDGIRYVESLSNTGDSQSVLLLGAEKTSAPELLYVLEDHLGIRQVVFASYEHAIKLSALLCKPKTDAWWRTIPITGKKLIIKSDVSCLINCTPQCSLFPNRASNYDPLPQSQPATLQTRQLLRGLRPWPRSKSPCLRFGPRF